MTLMTDTLPWLLVGLLAVGVLALLGRPLKHLLRLCGLQPRGRPHRGEPGGQSGQRPGDGAAGCARLRPAADAPLGLGPVKNRTGPGRKKWAGVHSFVKSLS